MYSRTAAAPLSLVRQLGDALDAADVRYCQWKGHWKAARWAQGDGDVDLLVDRAHVQRFLSVLCDLGFKEMLPHPNRQVPGIRSYYGLDRWTHRLVHLHVHTRLVFGGGPSYWLPLEKPLLDSAVRETTVFRTPAPELELIVLVLRLVERYSWREALRPGQPPWFGALLGEGEYLAGRADTSRLLALLGAHLPWIDLPFWAACWEALRPDLPRRRRVALRRELRQRLRPHAFAGGDRMAFARVLRRAARALGAHRPARKRPASGGLVVALVGADGAGKSVCAAELHRWLGKTLDTVHAHLGHPPRSLLSLAVGAALKAGAILEAAVAGGKGSLTLIRCLQLVRHLCTARDRYRLATKVRRFAAGGGVAICERYPIAHERILIGPRIPALIPTVRWRRVAEFLRDREAAYYRRIPVPDLLAVLEVHPETAVRRKTTEAPDYVLARARAVAGLDWAGTGAHVVDADRPLPQVLADLKTIIWSEL